MGINSRCAACKYLRKGCRSDCIFSPYFPSNGPRRFEFVHKVYGASNVARMLQRIPEEMREQAADTLYFEAQSRIEDPVYGCVRIIYQLQQELSAAQSQLLKAQSDIALLSIYYGSGQAHYEPESGPVCLLENFFPQYCYDDVGPFEATDALAQDHLPV